MKQSPTFLLHLLRFSETGRILPDVLVCAAIQRWAGLPDMDCVAGRAWVQTLLHRLEAMGPQTSPLSSLPHFPDVRKQFTVKCVGMTVRSKWLLLEQYRE